MKTVTIPMELEMPEVEEGLSVSVIDEDGHVHAKEVILTIDKLNDRTITGGSHRLEFAQF